MYSCDLRIVVKVASSVVKNFKIQIIWEDISEIHTISNPIKTPMTSYTEKPLSVHKREK